MFGDVSKPVPRVPSDVVGDRVRELRKKSGLTVDQLAGRCADIGAGELTANAIYLIEGGRRDKDRRRRRHVTVDEVMALAYALEISPLALILPGEDTSYQITEEDTVPARTVYEWLAGELLPPFPFPLEDITDEDRARAWYAFTSLVGYVPEPSAHWLVRAELARLREREQRLITEGRLREAMDSRRADRSATERLLMDAQDRLAHVRAQLDEAMRDADDQGSSEEARRRVDSLEAAAEHAQVSLAEVQYRHHSLVEQLHEITLAMKELDTGGDSGGR